MLTRGSLLLLLLPCVVHAETYVCSYRGYLTDKPVILKIEIRGAKAKVEDDEYDVITNSEVGVVLVLEMQLAGIKEREGPWWLLEYRVLDTKGNIALDLGRTDWADWSRDGDLLFAKEGSLFRARMNKRSGPAEPVKLIDLSGLSFEPVAAPPEATRWGGQPVSGSLLRRA
jgi:hypothetical protein